jgi:hypothetical protein
MSQQAKNSLGVLVLSVYLLVSQVLWFNKEMEKPYATVVSYYTGAERPPSYREWQIEQAETRGSHGTIVRGCVIGAVFGAVGLLFSWRRDA